MLANEITSLTTTSSLFQIYGGNLFTPNSSLIKYIIESIN